MTSRKDELYALARQAGDRWQASWNAMSGADCAEGEVYRYIRQVYVAVADGGDLETAIAKMETEWRVYAERNNAAIKAGPKIKRGPSSGHYVMGHRYTSPDFAQGKAIHIRNMVRIIDERLAREAAA